MSLPIILNSLFTARKIKGVKINDMDIDFMSTEPENPIHWYTHINNMKR